MSTLTIYKDEHTGSTVISNRFIDEYLKDANDAQIKVYLYLLRMISANLPTGISDIADKFNHTEKDVLRALKYWEKMRLLSLEYDENKELVGIRFTSPDKEVQPEVRPLAPIVPLKLVSQEVSADKAPAVEKTASADRDYPAKPTYSRDELKRFKDAPETGQILFVAETYLKRNLSMTDIETLYFIHNDLGFTCELIDYLLQYCVERDKKNFSYIRKVAISMAEAGITTPKQAKSFFANSYDRDVYTIMKALGRNGVPTPKEAEIIIKWYKTYGFAMDIISEACGRTCIATDSHRLEYCDKILSAWYKAGVKTVSDILKCDTEFKRPKASGENSSASAPKTSFSQINQSSYDFDALEKILGN